MTQKLMFGGETMPAPISVNYTNEKIWSDNAGRTADCTMVGDIRAIKKDHQAAMGAPHGRADRRHKSVYLQRR